MCLDCAFRKATLPLVSQELIYIFRCFESPGLNSFFLWHPPYLLHFLTSSPRYPPSSIPSATSCLSGFITTHLQRALLATLTYAPLYTITNTVRSISHFPNTSTHTHKIFHLTRTIAYIHRTCNHFPSFTPHQTSTHPTFTLTYPLHN